MHHHAFEKNGNWNILIRDRFNQNIKDNLSTVFPFGDEFIVAGRLDKASEGLLLISNNKNSEFLYLHVYDKENRNYDNRITKFFPLHHFTHSNVIAFLDFAIQILEDRQKNIV
ncbi:MAG: hypothetical protein RIQ76_320 [Pseudomonadota bacterium]